ncbi:MAG: addiction module protein [Campylobacterales bacterium]
MSIDEIKKLDTKEKIILMNDIWESLDKESESIESPLWHKEVLQDRVEKIKSGEAKYISLEDLKSR